MNDLTYIHEFATGKMLEIFVKRGKGSLPFLISNLKQEDLTPEENQEMLGFLKGFVDDICGQLSSEEIFLLAKFGAKITYES